jgi:outer membrane protein TolC
VEPARRAGRTTVSTTILATLLLGVIPVVAQGQEPWRKPAPEATGPTLTLPEAVRAAMDRNPQLRSARFGLEEARERVSEAWGSVLPSLDLSATYTRNVSPSVNFLPAAIFDPDADPNELIPVRFGADNTWSNSIDLEQPLFNAAAFIGVGAAGRYETLQEEVVRGQAHEVVTRVREAYYGLLLAQEQARLTENSVRRVRESLQETRALNRAGLASDYDVLRLEVELANLEPNLRRALNSVQQSRRQLGVDLGIPADQVEGLEVAGSLATMDLDDPSSNSADNQEILAFGGVDFRPGMGASAVVASALDSRSDVRQLALTQSLRKTEMRLEQVEYLPEISFFGTYAINSQQNGDPEFFGSPRAYTRNVGVRVTLPIFQGFQRDARIDQRRAVLRRAETETELARDQAASDVRTLVEQAEESLERAQAQALAVQQAGRGFEIARAQYREGLGSQLELTDAEVALRETEFNYAQAVYDYLVARARLDRAAGLVPLTGTAGGARP